MTNRGSMDKLYDDLLVELECPICMTYMSPPIRQCATGHSICEPCRKRLPKCPLCQGVFTDSKNISLEALARKMHYPCINSKSGCNERLSLHERDAHEKTCNFRGYKCPYPGCPWRGRYDTILEHWSQKRNLSRPYHDTNVCHTKIQKNEQSYVNMIQAFNEIFWYKFNLRNGQLSWTVQFVGPPECAMKYYFEIEIFKVAQPLRKILMSEYCQPIDYENKELFKSGNCVITTLDAVNHFIGEDQLLIYYLRVRQVDDIDCRQQRDQSSSRDSVTSEPERRNRNNPNRGRGRNFRGHQPRNNRPFNQKHNQTTHS